MWQNFKKRLFHDKNGNLVLFQAPNPPLIVWFIASILSRFVNGKIEQLAMVLAFGALFTWAWLEIFSGATYLRRALGTIILITIVVAATMRGSL